MTVAVSAVSSPLGADERAPNPYTATSKEPSVLYSTVPGYFHQSERSYNATRDYLDESFGLIDDGPKRWNHLREEVERLNEEARDGTAIKVFFLGRHGEGWHNVAERSYGTPEWNRYWSKVNGDGNMTWGPDARLTEIGIEQAKRVHRAWKAQALARAPVPSSLFSSPLSRAASTGEITFAGLSSVKPIFMETIRETIGVHTCDKRHSKTWLAQEYSGFSFEDSFAEEDELWLPDERETEEEQDQRSRRALDQIFASEKEDFISITAHGGTIGSILRVVGHPSVQTQTGSVTPVVIRAQRDASDESGMIPLPGAERPQANSAGAAQMVLHG
ncbi:putative phosphoglycerate mutase pmu1 [Rhodotorula sphaerocarpa]